MGLVLLQDSLMYLSLITHPTIHSSLRYIANGNDRLRTWLWTASMRRYNNALSGKF